MDVKKKFKSLYQKISRKKEIETANSTKVAVQDIFARFLQKVHEQRVANYLKIKDLCYDYTEIVSLFFEDKNEAFLKKLIFSLFIPFLYAELNTKERKKIEKHVIALHSHFESLLKDVIAERQSSISFRKTYLPKDEISETQ